MALIWKLGQINVAKQFHHGIKLLPRKNPAIPNIIQRLKSEVAIKSRSKNFRPSQISPNKQIPRAIIKYQLLDKLSPDYTLIYIDSITKLLKFSFHSTYIIIMCSIFGIFYINKYGNDDNLFLSSTVSDFFLMGIKIHDANEMIIMMIGLILLNSALFLAIRMHPTRIWYSPEKNLYKIVVIGDMPGFKKSIEFSPGSVVVKPRNFLNQLGYAVHYIKGKKYFILEKNFKTPADYNKLLNNTSVDH